MRHNKRTVGFYTWVMFFLPGGGGGGRVSSLHAININSLCLELCTQETAAEWRSNWDRLRRGHDMCGLCCCGAGIPCGVSV